MGDDLERHTRKLIGCPHCGELIAMNVQTTMHLASTADAVGAHDDLSDLSDKQREEIGKAKQAGVFAAWLNTFSADANGAISARPGKAERAYLRWWIQAARREFTPDVSRFLRDAYDIAGRSIYAMQFNQVTAVLVDGRLIAFMPTHTVLGRSGKNIKALDRRMPSIPDIDRWVRTKHGYVPADTRIFMTELQQRSVGDFSTVSLSK